MGRSPAFASSWRALVDAEPVLLVDDRRGRGRRTRPGPGGGRGSRPRRSHPRSRSSERFRAPAGERTASRSATGSRSPARRPASVAQCWRARRSGRREERDLRPVPRRRAPGVGGDGGLARADIALEEPEHRLVAGQVGPDRRSMRRAGLGQLDRPTEPSGRATPVIDRGPQRRAVLDGQGRPASGPAGDGADHAELEGEELIERNPPERASRASKVWIMGAPRAAAPIPASAAARTVGGTYSG